jgi:hypothetical protein
VFGIIGIYSNPTIIFILSDVEKLQADLDRLGDWAVENEMKINPNKSKALSFTKARVKDPLNYSLRDRNILEASCCKYLGTIMRSDLSWADQVNYTVQKAWKALHFIMHILKKGNKNTKSLAYTSLVGPIDSRIWGGVLGSIQGMSDKCSRPRTKESGQICATYWRHSLGIFGAA